MALIDKETIRKEIERKQRIARYQWRPQSEQLCQELLDWLDALPEQPDSKEKFRNLLDAMGDCGFSQDNILLLKSIWEDAGCQIPKREQPVIKKSNALFEECLANVDPAIRKEVSDNIDKILGEQPCRIVTEGLEKEFHDYIFYLGERNSNAGIIRDRPGYRAIVEMVARHFAEWGRKQVLQEIYDGKVKPVDKITAAWLDDEQNT